MKELITTICGGREVQLCWRPELQEINEYMDKGFIPIEMAEGQESFVDFRCLDHHGKYSYMPSACVTALKFYGTIGNDEQALFMANHTDADCVLTGLTLMGLLPYELLDKFNHEVGILDTDPLSVKLLDLNYGEHISLWKMGMMSAKNSGWSWLYGVQLFLDIFNNFSSYRKTLEKISAMEKNRIAIVYEDYKNAVVGNSEKVILINPSRAKGFDIHFGRNGAYPPNSLNGWRHWCVIANVSHSGSVTVACPNKEIAELAFGTGGLMNIYPSLPSVEGKYWGGRESIGGSPRGAVIPEELLSSVLEIIELSLSELAKKYLLRACNVKISLEQELN